MEKPVFMRWIIPQHNIALIIMASSLPLLDHGETILKLIFYNKICQNIYRFYPNKKTRSDTWRDENTKQDLWSKIYLLLPCLSIIRKSTFSLKIFFDIPVFASYKTWLQKTGVEVDVDSLKKLTTLVLIH